MTNFLPPKNEFLWVTITDLDGNTFFITSDRNRENYFIYNSECKKLGKNSDPTVLEHKYIKRKNK